MSIPHQYALRRRMMGRPLTFEQATWEQINAIGAAGRAADYWQPGDTKIITLPYAVLGSTTIAVEILGFYYDDLANGSGKAAISIGMVDCFATKQPMNSTATNVGGWGSCGLRTTIINTILPAFNAAIGANIIKPVRKRTSAGNKSTTINTTTDSLWLFSEYEVFGVVTHSVAGEKPTDKSICYPAFADANSRIKKCDGVDSSWYERSPRANYSTNFCFVHTNGNPSGNTVVATQPIGVAVGFCV